MARKKTNKKKVNQKRKENGKGPYNKLVKFLKIAFHNDKIKAHKELKNKEKVEKKMEKKVNENIKKEEQVSEQDIEHLERYFSDSRDSSLESDDEPDPPSAAAAISV